MYEFVDQRRIVYITVAIILFISSLIAPTAVFYPIKTVFITPAALYVGTSYLSLITGGIGIALFASGLIALAVFENRLKRYLVSGLLFAFGIVGVALSLADYYYMTEDAFIYNPPLSFSEASYLWEDFEKIEERIGKKDHTTSVESIALYVKNGDSIEMSSGKIFEMSGSLIYKIEQAGGSYERIDAASE
ncbi:hypothetical protein BN1080_02494 [Planococcus massiliensis]|uniref:Uncharacterized protein n=1 Tax=Planococcus massiliensis TaxID=1499687 RepID=A0A098EQD6_9BACL|nr:hypothetical protein [Planococcus massiliensis]CEG23516.1 hypothetical protein BN1080_02494 [Planococcus massiliensis]